MNSEKFSLRWNDFQSTVSQSLGLLRKEEDFFDVTLVSEDHSQMSAHKVVLSACSPFFKNIFRSNSHSHPLLYLGSINSTHLGFILDYIYQGEVHILQDQLDDFLQAAQRLNVKGLMGEGEESSEHIIWKLNIVRKSNKLEMLVILLRMKWLKKKCLRYQTQIIE